MNSGRPDITFFKGKSLQLSPSLEGGEFDLKTRKRNAELKLKKGSTNKKLTQS